MSRVSFNRKRVKLKKLLGIRARLALLALILVAPLMLERARSLEDTRAKQIALASAEFTSLAKHSADCQREVISSVETMLKSAAYIRASAGGVGRSCDILRASLPANLPWIRSLMIVGDDGRIQCSTNNMFVGLDLSDRPISSKARETRDFVFSDLSARQTHQHADRDGGLSGLRHQRRTPTPSFSPASISTGCRSHEQSRRPARHFGGAGRQHRHRAGGAGGSGQHDRPSARYRAAAVRRSPRRRSVRTSRKDRFHSSPPTARSARSALRASPARNRA